MMPMPMDDGAMNDAALQEALGGAPMPPGAPMTDQCPLCTGPVDPETGMTLAPPEVPMDAMGAPPGMPGGGMPPGMV